MFLEYGVEEAEREDVEGLDSAEKSMAELALRDFYGSDASVDSESVATAYSLMGSSHVEHPWEHLCEFARLLLPVVLIILRQVLFPSFVGSPKHKQSRATLTQVRNN